MNRQPRIALVTGGNRGLGLETSMQLAQAGHVVILTSRNRSKGEEAVHQLHQVGLQNVYFEQLDVSSGQSIHALFEQIMKKWKRLDILINNAAILSEENGEKEDEALFNLRRHHLEESLNTNVVGPYDLCERFIPVMLKQEYGRIVNVSSGSGQLSEPHAYDTAYSISKTALNAVTCFLASRIKGSNVLINSVCPGWVKTDMGGPNAIRSLDEGVAGIIWAATLPDGGPSGGFFRDGKPIQW